MTDSGANGASSGINGERLYRYRHRTPSAEPYCLPRCSRAVIYAFPPAWRVLGKQHLVLASAE